MVEPSRIPSELWAFGKQVVSEFVEDDCLSMAAALAYYTVFSLAPLVVAVLLLAGLVIPPNRPTRRSMRSSSNSSAPPPPSRSR